jgi:hypothetical protein
VAESVIGSAEPILVLVNAIAGFAIREPGHHQARDARTQQSKRNYKPYETRKLVWRRDVAPTRHPNR